MFHDVRLCFGSTAAKVFELADVHAMLGHAHLDHDDAVRPPPPGAEDAARLSTAFGGLLAPNVEAPVGNAG